MMMGLKCIKEFLGKSAEDILQVLLSSAASFSIVVSLRLVQSGTQGFTSQEVDSLTALVGNVPSPYRSL